MVPRLTRHPRLYFGGASEAAEQVAAFVLSDTPYLPQIKRQLLPPLLS